MSGAVVTLTLLPITALLFLLSGVSAPSHVRALTGKAGIMEFLRGCDAGRGQARVAAHGPVCGWQSLNAGRGSSVLSRTGDCLRRDEVVLARWGVEGAGRATEKKQYRTRFGFAEGAYLAVGPPADGVRTGRS